MSETAAKHTGKLSSKLLDMKFMKKPGDEDEDTNKEEEKPVDRPANANPEAWSLNFKSRPVKKAKIPTQLGYSEIQNTRFPVGRQLWKNGKCQDVRDLEKEAAPEVELDPELPTKKRKSESRKASAKKHRKR